MILARMSQYLFQSGHDHEADPKLATIMMPDTWSIWVTGTAWIDHKSRERSQISRKNREIPGCGEDLVHYAPAQI